MDPATTRLASLAPAVPQELLAGFAQAAVVEMVEAGKGIAAME